MSKTLRKANIPMLAAAGIATFALAAGVVFAATKSATFTLKINPGILTVDIKNTSGVSVESPSIAFEAVNASGDENTTTATLGTTDQYIYIENLDDETTSHGFSLTLDGNESAKWISGTDSFSYNKADDGLLSLITDNVVITPLSQASKTIGTLSKGDSNQDFTNNSVRLIETSTRSNGAWGITNFELKQTIPAYQASGNYSLNLTLSAVGNN